MSDKKLAFIGIGRMATSIIKGILRSKLYLPNEIIGTHYKESKIIELRKELPIEIIPSNIEAVRRTNIIFLCVRPQQMRALLLELSPYITKEKFIVSIAAGIPVQKIKAKLIHKPIVVHIHPTSLAFSSNPLGVSFIEANPEVDEFRMNLIKDIFSIFGEVKIVNQEELNKYIVMGGCVPAFISFIVYYLTEIGKELGMSHNEATELESRMVIGIKNLIYNEHFTPEEIIEKIATPNGITTEGLSVFKSSILKDILNEAIHASLKKLEIMKNVLD